MALESPGSPASRLHPGLLVAAIVVAVTSRVYHDAAVSYFTDDDFGWLTDAASFRFQNIFDLARYRHFYRPMIELYFATGYRLFGCDALGFHLASIAIHLSALLALYLFARALTGRPAFAGAAAVLFASLPGYLEAVAWVAAITDLLSAFWYITSIWLYLRFVQGGGLTFYLLALATFAACLLTHESAATLDAASKHSAEVTMQVVAGLLLAVSLNQPAAPAATGGMTGRITAEGTNAPIPGARVLLFPASRVAHPLGPPPQAITDQEGRFAFTRLVPGEYRLDVQKTGFVPPNRPPARPPTFTVAAGQPLAVDLQLQRGGVISGRVLDVRGEPLTDARVMALRRVAMPARGGPNVPRLLPAPIQGLQQTNDLGDFRVAGLAPGEYVIAAVPHGFTSFGGPAVAPTSSPRGAHTTAVTTFYPGTADQAGAQTITVGAGAEVGNVVFMVQSAPAFRVSGVVVDESGAPISDAMVRLMPDPRSGGIGFGVGAIGNGRSDANGRFAIDDVPAGTYRAMASVLVRMTSSGGIGAGSVGGYVSGSGMAGGVVAGQSVSLSSGPLGGSDPVEVVVADSDVSGIRIVARRPTPLQ
jgi:hypothetical protein